MRKFNLLFVFCLYSIALFWPTFSFAEVNDPLADYRNMIKKSLAQPVINSDMQKPDANPKATSGQAALIPAAPPPALPLQTMPNPTPVPPSNYPNNNANDPNNSPATAPAATPNIFVTPNNKTNNNQSAPVIHY